MSLLGDFISKINGSGNICPIEEQYFSEPGVLIRYHFEIAQSISIGGICLFPHETTSNGSYGFWAWVPLLNGIVNFSLINEALDYLDGKRKSWCDKRWIQFGIFKVRERLDNSVGILTGQSRIQLFGGNIWQEERASLTHTDSLSETARCISIFTAFCSF